MQTSFKKLLSFLLVCTMMCSLLVGLFPATAVFAAGETVSKDDAPYAGVYAVTSDKAVTITNETGATATLSAGQTKYIYLVKGANKLTTTVSNATITYTTLDNNGLDYLNQVTFKSHPVITGQEDAVAMGINKSVAPGASYTFKYTPSAGKNGIVYPYILFSAGSEATISTDTGFTTKLGGFGGQTGTTWAWQDAARSVVALLYVRAGENTITLTNTGSNNLTITNIRIHSVGEYKTDITMNQLTPMTLAQLNPTPTPTPTATPTPTPKPTATPTPTPVPANEITYTAPAAGVYKVTSDKAVTLVNETGTKATVAANGSSYIYLIEGVNKMTTTDKSASLTFIQLENNGLNYLSQVSVDYIPYGEEHVQAQITSIVDSEGGYMAYGNQLILEPGAFVVVKATMSKDGAGIIYPFIQIYDNYQHTFKISTDTGFYAELLKDSTNYQSTCWIDGSAQKDMEILYVREGENLITIENTGSNTATIAALRMSMTDGSDSIKNSAWGSQLNIQNLKPIEREIVATPEPTAPPQATFAPVGTITYEAPNAGIYRVASDKAVTLINETGSTATLSGSGVVKYLYLIKGANKLSTSNLSADITFTQLDAFGMNQMAKVETAYTAYGKEHVSPVDIHSFVTADGTFQTGINDNGKFVNLSPGASVTFELTMSKDGAGIVYPFIGVIDEAENTFEISSDTGFYAEIYKPVAAGSYCWSDMDKQDLELLYVREGANLITIKNTGASIATVTAFRLSMTDGEDGIKDHESWGPQINLQNLKVFSGYSSAPVATPEPELPDVSNTNLYTVIEAETVGTPTTYNEKTAVKFDHEMVTSASYTINADQETVYNVSLIGAAWKDVSFDLYVDGTLADYATMHFQQDRSSKSWTYLQEEVAQIHVGAGSHTLKFDFYCDSFYLDAIVLEDTNSMYYHLIHDFANITTAEGAYNLFKQYGAAANIDVEADTANHVYAPMSFWSMAGKNFETASDMLAAYAECIIDPAVIVKDSNGQEVGAMPQGTAYVTADCQYVSADASLIAAVYQGKQLVAISAMTRADGLATAAFTQLPAGCTLKVLVMSDLAEAAPYATEVYGTTYREIYVATNGKSSNAGTKDAPVNNLANALKIVKTINNDMTGDIIINVAPGTYKTSVAIEIDTTMSGKNGHKVIIRAEDPDNQPVISGGEDLTGKWSKVDGKNYYVASTTTRETRALFVNGYQATMARSDGWYGGVNMDPENPKNDSHVTDGILISYYGNSNFPMGLDQQTETQASRMQLVYSLQWANHRFPIDRIEYGANNAYIYTTYPYYNSACIEDLFTSTIAPEGQEFYFENSLLLLDQPGEFYFDKENRKMYYYPYAQENMATIETWCATTDRMLSITGVSSTNKVTNMEFDGIAFRYGGFDDITVKGAAFNQTEEWRIGSETYYGQHLFPGQIWLNYADSVNFKNCEFGSMGSSALIFEEGVSNSGVYGSYFHDIAGTGVVLGDYRDGNSAPSATERCQNLTVDNNIFRRTAQEYQGLTAISIYYVGNATVTHNDIKDTSYSGIVVGWGWGYDDPANCGNHNISYNKIEDVMQTMGDGAHIYTLGNLRGTQINDNYIIDPGQIKAPGIYFDQGTGYTNACDNVVTEAYTTTTDRWLFARQLVNINNCFVGYNHTDGRDPTDFYGTNGTSTKDVALKYNKYRVTSWNTTAQKIMAAAGVEDKARLNEIDAYPSWRTMRMMDIPAY